MRPDWGESPALIVEQLAHQGRGGALGPSGPAARVGDHHGLSLGEHLRWDDGRMMSRERFAAMDDLAEINPVLQDVVERAAAER